MRTIFDTLGVDSLRRRVRMQEKFTGVDAEWARVRARESGIWRRPEARRMFAEARGPGALPALSHGVRWALLLAFSLAVGAVVLDTLSTLTEQLLDLGTTASNRARRTP
jgi:hypothetical protein